jgi:hypothetical protein
MTHAVRVIEIGPDPAQWAVEHRADENELGTAAYTQENLPKRIVIRDDTGIRHDVPDGVRWTVQVDDEWYTQHPNIPIPSAEAQHIAELEARLEALERRP